MSLLSLGTSLLSGCNASHQLGVRDNPQDNPQEILNTKLNNPHAELTSSQSISLLTHCTMLGEHNAAAATDKEVLVVLGNTGVGKSTTVNYLVGCEMRADIGRLGEEIIVVDPESNLREVMPIGHNIRSQTFMPQVALDSDDPNVAYCDCPGFTDNRGAEINITNSINIKRILQNATSVKAIFLAEYSDLLARGLGIQSMENMCQQMFGGGANLRRYQNSILLGITKAPLCNISRQPLLLNTVRARITEVGTPIALILANRAFLFDPLDRATDNPDFWSIERCRTEIAQLASIPRQETTELFQTVLTSGDEAKLKHILRDQATALAGALEQDDYPAAGRHWQSLTRLRAIDSAEVEQMIKELAGLPLKNFVLRRIDTYKLEALQYNFEEAERQLNLLRTLINHFPHEQLECSIENLETVLRNSKEKKRIEEESIQNRLRQAQREAAKKAREEADKELERRAEEARRLMNSRCCTIL